MKITRNKKAFNEFKVETKWTLGKILCLKNALETYFMASSSPLGEELLDELKRAMVADGINLENPQV